MKVRIEQALATDVPAIVELLRDVVVGAIREGADPAAHDAAFAAIDADPAHLLVVARDGERVDAHRFSERLGHVASHEGMKRLLR